MQQVHNFLTSGKFDTRAIDEGINLTSEKRQMYAWVGNNICSMTITKSETNPKTSTYILLLEWKTKVTCQRSIPTYVYTLKAEIQ